MNALYFYSHNDGEIRAVSLESIKQTTSVINKDFNVGFLDFLRYRSLVVDSYLLNRWQNSIGFKDIQLILDALGFAKNQVVNGAEFNGFLLNNSRVKAYLFASAYKNNPSLKDKLCLKYLQWVFNNYIRIFNKHYGELILMVSDDKPITRLPGALHLMTYKNDKRHFYSSQDRNKTRELCLACGVRISASDDSNLLDFKPKRA